MTIKKAQYRMVQEFDAMCQELTRQQPERYGHIDPKGLRMVAIINRDPPDSGPAFRVIRVNDPIALFCSFRHVIVTWGGTWDKMGQSGQQLLVADAIDSCRAEI